MFSLIITAAGSGSRMGLGYNKMLYKHNDEYLFNITLSKFINMDCFAEIFLVVSQQDHDFIKENLLNNSNIKIVLGGETRQESISNATKMCSQKYVMIHDGARCFIKETYILSLIDSIKEYQIGASLAIAETDSVRKVINNEVVELLNREEVYKMQTL